MDWKAGQKDRIYIEQSLAFLTASAARLGWFLSIVEARGPDRGMPEIALPLRLLLAEIAPQSKSDAFIFFATHDFNFYYSDFYRQLRRPLLLSDDNEARAFFSGLPAHMALVAYSSIERQNILTLIILVHELSHYLDGILKIQSGGPKPAVSIKALNRWLSEAHRIKYVPSELVREFKTASHVPQGVLDFYLKLSLLRQLEHSSIWIRELIADRLATRLLGLGFFLTQRKFLGFFPGDDQNEYPPHYRRYWAIARELLDSKFGVERQWAKGKQTRARGDMGRALADIVHLLRAHNKEASASHASRAGKVTETSSDEQKVLYLRLLGRDIVEKAIAGPMKHAVKRIRTVAPDTDAARITARVLEVADLLRAGIAPSQNLRRAITAPPAGYSVQEILNGAWVEWIGTVDTKEDARDWAARLAGMSRLALRGIELAHFMSRYPKKDSAQWRQEFRRLKPASAKPTRREIRAGVLRREDLIRRMLAGRSDNRLVIGPINHPKQIGDSSIDVRLGNSFLVVATTRTPSLGIGGGAKIPANYYEFHKLSLDDTLLLHPREFMLGSTLEYVSLPLDVMAYVIGRSTLGRLGLVIATATHVAPGYKGTLTLELTNVGTVPLELKPGVRVAQLVFHKLTGRASRPYAGHGRYAFSVGPEIPKL